MHCKSLWIKASAKYVIVNVFTEGIFDISFYHSINQNIPPTGRKKDIFIMV